MRPEHETILAGLLCVLIALGTALFAAMFLTGCSAGPQTPIVTTPMHISCTWNLQDGGTAEDCDCLIDRSSAESGSEATGNRVRDVTVSPDTDVSALPASPAPIP